MIKLLPVFFTKKAESLQYNTAFATPGAVRGTSRKWIYQKSGLESLQQRWYRKLCFSFKIYKNQRPKHIFDIIPLSSCQYRSRNAQNIPPYQCEEPLFKKLMFFINRN